MTVRSMYVYNGSTWDEVGYTVSHDIPAAGTTGQVLAKVSAGDYDTAWADPDRFTVNAKGDLLVGTAADTVGRLAVGSDGTLVVADSGATSGVAWAPRRLAFPTSYYRANGIYSNVATATATQGLQTFWPFFVDQRMTISEFRFYVGTGAAAGAYWRMGFHSTNATNVAPGALLADMGQVDVTASGVKAITGLSVAFTPGMYWVSYALQGSGAGGGTFGYSASQSIAVPRTSAGLTSQGVCTQTGVTGAFADPAVPNGYAATSVPFHFEMLRSA